LAVAVTHDTATDGPDDDNASWLYEDGEIQTLATEIDVFGPAATDPWDLMLKLTRRHFEAGTRESRGRLVVMAERAFAHAITDDPNRYGASVMGERFSSAEGEWPPAFETVDPREKACWLDLCARVTHDLPKTHLRDVVLAAGLASGLPEAERVVEGYRRLATQEGLDAHYRASCLRRASSLARQFALPVETLVRQELWDMALAAVTEGLTHVLFQCLEPLAIPPRTGPFAHPERDEVRGLVDALQGGHGQSDLVVDFIHELRVKLAETDLERLGAHRSFVEGYLSIAQEAEGLVRLHWLQRAASEAQTFGLNDLRGAAVAAMQDMPIEELGMQTVTSQLTVPRNLVDWRMSRYRGARTALQALDIWLTTPAPTGSHESNLREAERASGGILQLVSRITIDGNGMPVRSSAGPEEAQAEALERREIFIAKANAVTLGNELLAIKTELGASSPQEVGAHLATKYRCDMETATSFGQALQSFWDGRYDDAARAAYPLIEAGARGLLLALGEPIFRIETGNSEGRFPALETYAARLETLGFDIDWLRTLRNPVSTMRNSIAHGHNLRPTDVDAIILLRTAGLFVVLCPLDSSQVERAEVEQRLRDPIAFVAKSARLRKRLRMVWTAGDR